MSRDDAAVPPGVGDGGRGRLEVEQEAGTADVLQHPGAAELVGDGDRVGRLSGRDQRPDGVVDELVRRLVEVLRAEAHLRDRGDGVGGQQQRPEERALRFDVVRRDTAGTATQPSFRSLNHAGSPSPMSAVGY